MLPATPPLEANTMELYDVMRTTFSAREFTDAAVADTILQRGKR